MRPGFLWMLAIVLPAAQPALAQEQKGFNRLSLRVTAKRGATSVIVDRGNRDLLKVGDRVLFHPRKGGSLEGTVTVTAARSAVVELRNKNEIPAPGTRGEVFVPKARKPKEAKKPKGEEGKETKKKIPFRNKDKDYKRGKPLLTGFSPQRPKDRGLRISGRHYFIGEFSKLGGDSHSNSFFRIGTDVEYENPFAKGGALRIQAELDRRTEYNDKNGFDLLAQRLSYRLGGTRFDPERIEIGRFLQHGLPELGVLDGISYDSRLRDGDRFGASVGWMPEPDDDFESGRDFQLAAYYKWVADEDERVSLSLGVHKSFHNGKTDRDLIITTFQYLPVDAWEFHGTTWVDYYESKDNEKGKGFELTQAILSLNRSWEDGSGMALNYSHIRFPQLLRNEFPPQAVGDLADQRYDRLALRSWSEYEDGTRLLMELAAWDDENDSGASAELSWDIPELVFDKARTELTVFGSVAKFSTVGGGRIVHSRQYENIHWDLLYEAANHHQNGFQSGTDDILQHRFRISRSAYYDSGWSITTFAEGRVWDENLSWSLALQLQKSF